MFWHNFKYTLKTLFKNKMLIFWTFAFPIILGLFFNMAFSGIEESETFSALDIAVVNDDNFQNNTTFKMVLEELSNEKNKIFNTKYVNLKEAKNLLKKDKIVGYLIFEKDKPKIVINSSGSYETIFKNVIDEISQTILINNNMIQDEIIKGNKLGNYIDYQAIYQKVEKIIQESKSNIEDISSSNLYINCYDMFIWWGY